MGDKLVEVSIVMPMRDAEQYVAEAIGSVLSQAEAVSLEVVVVDDGSRDGSRLIVTGISDDRVKLVDGRQRGIAAAWNTGFNVCEGRYVARCDADDRFRPGRLARQVAWLDSNRDFAAVCSGFETVGPDGTVAARLSEAESMEITEELLAGRTRTTFCTYLVRREVIKKLGGAREYFETGEDVDLQLRIADAGRVWYECGCGYQYRLHDASITHRQLDKRRAFFEDTARYFAQQRRYFGIDDLAAGRPPVPPVVDQGSRRSARRHLTGHLHGQAARDRTAGRRLQAIRLLGRCVRLEPGRWLHWRALVTAILKGRPQKG